LQLQTAGLSTSALFDAFWQDADAANLAPRLAVDSPANVSIWAVAPVITTRDWDTILGDIALALRNVGIGKFALCSSLSKQRIFEVMHWIHLFSLNLFHLLLPDHQHKDKHVWRHYPICLSASCTASNNAPEHLGNKASRAAYITNWQAADVFSESFGSQPHRYPIS
jgi:hypothetical protein